MSRAVKALRGVGPEYQVLFAHVILKVCDIFLTRKKEKANGLMEIGAEKIVGVLKAQNKRRWYDQNKTMHKAFTGMYRLEYHQQGYLGRRLLDAINLTDVYIESCDQNRRPSDLYEVIEMLQLIVRDGFEAGKRYLVRLNLWDDALAEDIQSRREEEYQKHHSMPLPLIKRNSKLPFELPAEFRSPVVTEDTEEETSLRLSNELF